MLSFFGAFAEHLHVAKGKSVPKEARLGVGAAPSAASALSCNACPETVTLTWMPSGRDCGAGAGCGAPGRCPLAHTRVAATRVRAALQVAHFTTNYRVIEG